MSDIDKELAPLATKLAKARHLKQNIMQELLTGRTRLVSESAMQPISSDTAPYRTTETQLHGSGTDGGASLGWKI